jgi:hypothetical protein
MGFVTRSSAIQLYAYMTQYARDRILNGDIEDFKITHFSLHDDDINYQIAKKEIGTDVTGGTIYNLVSSGFIPDITGDITSCIKSIAKGVEIRGCVLGNFVPPTQFLKKWISSYFLTTQTLPQGSYIETFIGFTSGLKITLNVLYDTNVIKTVQNLVNRINNPITPKLWVNGPSYFATEVVIDSQGFYWQSDYNNNTYPLNEDDGYWFKIGNFANWNFYYQNQYPNMGFPIIPSIFYTDPNIVFLQAISTQGDNPNYEGTFKVYDKRGLNTNDAFATNSFGNISYDGWSFGEATTGEN